MTISFDIPHFFSIGSIGVVCYNWPFGLVKKVRHLNCADKLLKYILIELSDLIGLLDLSAG